MVDSLLANDCEFARRAGLMYLIYDRKMVRFYPYNGASPGTASDYHGPSPHTDHVHVSFSWKGARGETSLYREIAPLEGIA